MVAVKAAARGGDLLKHPRNARQMNIPFQSSDPDQVKKLSDYVALITRFIFCSALSLGIGDYIRTSDLPPFESAGLFFISLTFGFLGLALAASIMGQTQNYFNFVFDSKNFLISLLALAISLIVFIGVYVGATILVSVAKFNIAVSVGSIL
ncbi:hypothetical protein [Ahrensia sp. 13_GOM-1096m]|uniref:hypothetical protein n=1 Tax=Ahrensia sp. 13_GOM-1096m TaxID=1380380 RepID=UPI00138B01B6|nr:hypothetical protein [Ahrensia sp. 13_GOM-1096m]